MKQVIDAPPNASVRVCINTLKHGQLSQSVDAQPLPAYVSQLALDNTELTDLVCKYKDFVSHLCHALGMSLESELVDIEKRVSKLQEEKTGENELKAFMSDIHHAIGVTPEWAYGTTALLALIRKRQKSSEKFDKLTGLVQDFTQELHENHFIELAEAK